MSESRPYIDLHRAREEILQMVADDLAAFRFEVSEQYREEYVEVSIEYEICGVHYRRDEGVLKLIVNINRMEPSEVDVNYDRLYDELERNIMVRLPFLLKDSFYASIDRKSVRDINRQGRLKEFKYDLARAVERRGFRKEEVLPVLMEFVRESLPDTRFQSIEEVSNKKKQERKKQDTIIEISPPGAPCPYCNGHLSERNLKNMLMKLYSRYRGDGYDY